MFAVLKTTVFELGDDDLWVPIGKSQFGPMTSIDLRKRGGFSTERPEDAPFVCECDDAEDALTLMPFASSASLRAYRGVRFYGKSYADSLRAATEFVEDNILLFWSERFSAENIARLITETVENEHDLEITKTAVEIQRALLNSWVPRKDAS